MVLHPRRFMWPIVLAIGVHGLLLAGPIPELWSIKPLPEEQSLVQVELVESPVPQVVPRPVPAVVEAPPPRPVPAPPVSSPEPVPAVVEAPPPPRPVLAVAEAPKASAPAVQPTRVDAEPAPPTEPEPVVVPSHLSVNTMPAPVHRSLRAVATGPKRALRDTAAESDAIRSKARLGDNPKPVYPRSAREFGWEGTVMLRVEVLENGLSGAVLVHKTCGHEVLDNAALSAVQKWKFAPAMDGAFPVRSVVYLPVQFDLRAAR